MKKHLLWVLCALVLLLALNLAACSSNSGGEQSEQQRENVIEPNMDIDPDEPPILVVDWKLSVEGVDGVTEYLSSQALELATATIDVGGQSYTGITAKALLESLGATAFTTVTLTGTDGAAHFDSAKIQSDSTIIAWSRNGEPIEDGGPLYAIIDGSEDVMVKSLTGIKVE